MIRGHLFLREGLLSSLSMDSDPSFQFPLHIKEPRSIENFASNFLSMFMTFLIVQEIVELFTKGLS